jgi:leucyl aminopeptidase
MKLQTAARPSKSDVPVYLLGPDTDWAKVALPAEALQAARQAFKSDQELLYFPASPTPALAIWLGKDGNAPADLERYRRLGAEATEELNRRKQASAYLIQETQRSEAAFGFAEGMALAGYQFRKYRSNGDGRFSLQNIKIPAATLPKAAMAELTGLVTATCHARDLVNEPLSFLTAPRFALEIKRLGKEAGYKTTVLQKAKLEAMKMGGILAVNKGSVDPPTFSILEWKSPKAKNKKPIVLVGKGVVYDTGGLSLKTTKNSMDFMKCDMGGAAAVVGAVYAAAKNKLPVHVIGLVPASDNRPGGNAYVPGDIITMYSGHTVEVLNTDAEGRMLLADALHYAKRYKPQLVIDLATLTGAAAAAIGPLGVVAMGTADRKTTDRLKASGDAVHERLAELPFWDEFGDEIRSDIADMKNVGGGFGGAITAGKFLAHYTDYPWIHLDIAGPAWLHATNAYRTKFGTGVGVRLLYHFLKNNAS